jgi:hypothetical protein
MLGGGRFVLALSHALCALGALVHHEYLLDRSTLAPALALFVASGWVLRAWKWTCTPAVTGVLLILAIAAATMDVARREDVRSVFYPPTVKNLVPLSEVVIASLPAAGTLRVLGTFNEFSAGWVRILEARHGRGGVVEIDAPYPLVPTRDGWNAEWSDAYSELVAAWADDGTRTIVAIEVEPSSPLHTDDYRLWNAWKRNLVAAVRGSDRFAHAGSTAIAEGVRVERFTLSVVEDDGFVEPER